MSADSDSDADVAPTERHREGSADDAEVNPLPHRQRINFSCRRLMHRCITDGEAEQSK